MEVGGLCDVLQGLKPVMLMVVVQISFAAVNIVYKLAINDGMSMRVATAYRLLFASAFTILIALIFDRKKRAKITGRVLFLEFLCGLFGGTLFLNFYFAALVLLPATYVLAIMNLAPAITFIMAITSRLEKLNLRAAAGKAKVIGTITGISGAMLLTFYKGEELDIWSSHINLMRPHPLHYMSSSQSDSSGTKFLGISYAIASCSSFALWLNIQAKTNEEYPSHRTGTALMCTMGGIQSTVFALCVDRDWTQWKLGWNIRLLTVTYAGIVASGMVVNIFAWCVHMRGPLFASVFNPLQLVLVAIAASLLLNENLYLGSVLGAVLILCGLYSVLWGNSKEIQKKIQLVPLDMATTESQTCQVQVLVIDHDNKCHHTEQSQTTTTMNTSASKDKGEELPT